MAVTQNFVTSNFNVHSAKQFIESFSEVDGSQYFVYAGKHTPYVNSDAAITVPDNSVQKTHFDTYNDMLFAKRVTSGDIVHVIPKYTWKANTVYSEYSHLDGALLDKPFYVMVDDTYEYNVYKCLFNMDGANSTVAPSRVGSSADLKPMITGDGYTWKYMYTITKTNYDKFATANYIPVTANTDVIAGATPGTIEVIKVLDGGSGYSNYIEDATFKTGDINIGGVNTIYGAPESSPDIDDYYQGCVLKVTSGAGIDQYRRIVNYEGVGVQKKFILDAGFEVTPLVGDHYEVYPYIYVWGDGNESLVADARAIIEPLSANAIVSVEMLSVGENYRYAVGVAGDTPSTIPITINSIYIQLPEVITQDVNFEQASLEPILSPKDGHGSDPLNELGAKRVCISTKFNQSESGTIPTQNDFRQIGLIKDPLYTNVDLLLKTANTVGSFSIGETVRQYKHVKLAGNVVVTTANKALVKVDQGKISNTITILNAGVGYNNTANNQLVANNTGTSGTGAAATFSNNGSGVITSVTVTNQGSGYLSPPVFTVNPTASSGGSNAVFDSTLANPLVTYYKDAFEVGDYVLVNNGSTNYLTKVDGVPYDYQITTSTNGAYVSTSSQISSLKLLASGTVSSVSVGQITLSNVSGTFSTESRVIGLTSGATSIIDTGGIQINDKAAGAFTSAVQLTRLVGNFTTGSSPFIEDEYISQNSLISYAKPHGQLHHAEIVGGINDDTLYISNKFGIYNLDPGGVRTIVGNTSGATLDTLLSKYPGDFVVGSGEVLYYENLDAITRSDNKSEIIKIILEF